jgi:hypothetical protein
MIETEGWRSPPRRLYIATAIATLGTALYSITTDGGVGGERVTKIQIPNDGAHECKFITSDVPYMRYPRQYVAYEVGGTAGTGGIAGTRTHAYSPAPVIDGKLDDIAWTEVAWSDDFEDIMGNDGEGPRFKTRVKMRWDVEWLYVAAEMEEPQAWANLTTKNSVIFNDNDFEVFVDVDGSTHGMVFRPSLLP